MAITLPYESVIFYFYVELRRVKGKKQYDKLSFCPTLCYWAWRYCRSGVSWVKAVKWKSSMPLYVATVSFASLLNLQLTSYSLFAAITQICLCIIKPCWKYEHLISVVYIHHQHVHSISWVSTCFSYKENMGMKTIIYLYFFLWDFLMCNIEVPTVLKMLETEGITWADIMLLECSHIL